MHTYIHTYIHTYVYLYIHTYIHRWNEYEDREFLEAAVRRYTLMLMLMKKYPDEFIVPTYDVVRYVCIHMHACIHVCADIHSC